MGIGTQPTGWAIQADCSAPHPPPHLCLTCRGVADVDVHLDGFPDPGPAIDVDGNERQIASGACAVATVAVVVAVLVIVRRAEKE